MAVKSNKQEYARLKLVAEVSAALSRFNENYPPKDHPGPYLGSNTHAWAVEMANRAVAWMEGRGTPQPNTVVIPGLES